MFPAKFQITITCHTWTFLCQKQRATSQVRSHMISNPVSPTWFQCQKEGIGRERGEDAAAASAL